MAVPSLVGNRSGKVGAAPPPPGSWRGPGTRPPLSNENANPQSAGSLKQIRGDKTAPRRPRVPQASAGLQPAAPGYLPGWGRGRGPSSAREPPPDRRRRLPRGKARGRGRSWGAARAPPRSRPGRRARLRSGDNDGGGHVGTGSAHLESGAAAATCLGALGSAPGPGSAAGQSRPSSRQRGPRPGAGSARLDSRGGKPSPSHTATEGGAGRVSKDRLTS